MRERTFRAKINVMKRVDSSKVLKFEDASLPNEPYVFVDGYNNEVRISELNPEKHTVHDSILLNDPSVYGNIGFAVRNATGVRRTRKEKDGITKVYRCDNFLDKIDHPAKYTKKNLAIEVAVKYKENNFNCVKTYYDIPGGTE